jgi:hypothetical protein
MMRTSSSHAIALAKLNYLMAMAALKTVAISMSALLPFSI